MLKAVQKKCTFYQYGLNLAASNKCRLRSAIDIILQIVPYAMQRVASKQQILFFSKGPNETIFLFLVVRQNGLKKCSNFTDVKTLIEIYSPKSIR